MEVLEIILYILAYTLGVITIFLELVCYNKKIEYLETILFTAAFLFFIIALSINLFFTPDQVECYSLNNLILLALILIGLTTPLNIFAERQVNVPPIVKHALYATSILLLILLAVKAINIFDFFIEALILGFLVSSIIASMILIKMTKPEKRLLHKEKSEQVLSLLILIIIPFVVFIEFIAPNGGKISITPPVLFILLALPKLLDDLNRLSLFTSDNKIEVQNAKNYLLTPRETEIADLLIKGHSYANISESLFIAMPTVKSHVSNIYKKVKVKNKIELLLALKS